MITENGKGGLKKLDRPKRICANFVSWGNWQLAAARDKRLDWPFIHYSATAPAALHQLKVRGLMKSLFNRCYYSECNYF